MMIRPQAERIDKSDYKQAVKREKIKLRRQVVLMTLLAFLVSAAFYVTLINANPHSH